MFEQTGCDAVMLGRPALRNPWIFRQLSQLLAGHEPFQPTGSDLVQHLKRLSVGLASRLREPDQTPLGPLKEQVRYLCRAIPNSLELERRLLRQPTLELLLEAAEEALSRLPCDALDLGVDARAVA
jgi:tRNA-dihydrouridine synthase